MMRSIYLLLMAALCGCGDQKFPTNGPPIVTSPSDEVSPYDLFGADGRPIVRDTWKTPSDWLHVATPTGLTAADLISRCTPEELELWQSYSPDVKRLFVPYVDKLPLTEVEAIKLIRGERTGDSSQSTTWDEREIGGVIVRMQPAHMKMLDGRYAARVHNEWYNCPREEVALLKSLDAKHPAQVQGGGVVDGSGVLIFPAKPVNEPAEPMSSIDPFHEVIERQLHRQYRPYALFDSDGQLIWSTNDPVNEPREPMSAIKSDDRSREVSNVWHPAGLHLQGDRISDYPLPMNTQRKDPATKQWPPRVCYDRERRQIVNVVTVSAQ